MIWLIIAGVLLVIELLSGTIAFLCFSLGAIGGMIPALFGMSVVWQVVFCAVISILCFIFLRPAIRESSLQLKGKEARTNMDALIGRRGKVTHEVTAYADDKGRVQIDGDSWLAYTTSHECPIPKGAQVEVEGYDSIVLKVRPV